MGEFVEEKFEKLLPLFEQLKNVDILKNEEVQELVKRCRRYEYRLAKQVKNEADYVVYADYLLDLLELISKRRERLSYAHRYKEIEGIINSKIGGLYFACALRCKKKISLWYKCIDFLVNKKLNSMCSKVFTTALQFHSSDKDLRCRSAKWELSGNNSIENARSQLQLVLRNQHQETTYWICLFEIELSFAKKMRERLEFLKKRDKTEDSEIATSQTVDDAILDFKVVEVVLNQALRKVNDHTKVAEMLHSMWEFSFQQGPALERITNLIYDKLQKLTDPGEVEYAILASFEKKCHDEGKYILDCFDDAFEKCSTEKLCRIFLNICEKSDAADALIEGNKIRQKLIDMGVALVDDIQKVLISYDLADKDVDNKVLEITKESLKTHQGDAKLWELHLGARINLLTGSKRKESIEKQKEDLMEVFDEAFKKVSLNEQLQIWKLAIDFAIENEPSKMDAIFSQCFLIAPCSVSSPIKVIRLNYMEALGNIEQFRNEAHRLMDMKPNSYSVYVRIAEIESKRQEGMDKKLCEMALKLAVNENEQSPDAWLEYLKFLLEHKPQSVANAHQRAILALTDVASEELEIGWMKFNRSL
ncbi:unnamed protein product, partial [Mesorhabditis belari]|uniref:U3 small nucleolar RNA-associated protein 6 homolog n=1 Tax=Mesorhabditis belari TaxID=2138241 RepID=A0AAF3F0H2_9BILA